MPVGMVFKLTVEGVLGQAEGIARRELANMKRAAFHRIGSKWHEDMRPQHFTEQAYSLYGYQARSPNYVKWKRRRLGHNRPHFKSGETFNRTRIKDIRPTAKGVRIVLHAQKLNFRRNANAPNQRKEITTVIPAEIRVLEALFVNHMEQAIAANRARSVTVIRPAA